MGHLGKYKKFFVFEAIFFALMAATSESYALYYYTKYQGEQLKIGLLATLPILCGALIQYWLNRSGRKIDNRKGVVFFQTIQLIGLILIALYYYYQSDLVIFLGLILYWVGGQNALPFWMDWTSAFIPFDQLSPFLNMRNRLVGIVSLTVFLASAYWLKLENVFQFIFLIGLAARIVSYILNLRIMRIAHTEVDAAVPSEEEISSISHEEKSIIPKILLPLSFFRLSVNLASPFFLPFMTQELKLSALSYALLSATPLLTRVIFIGNWISINKGGKPFQIIQICALGISILPILWALNSQVHFLLCYQFLSGFFWTGMEFSSTLMIQNFTYGHSRLLFSKLNAMNTFFTVCGAVIGGWLFYYQISYAQVFTYSTYFRFISALLLIYFLRKIPETKLQLKLIRPIILSAISIRPSHANTFKMVFSRKERSD